jgi:ferredoxin-NADP reductase
MSSTTPSTTPSTTTVTVTVADRRRLTDRVTEFRLVPATGVLPEWTPGSHLDVHVPTPDGRTLVRQYSLCSDPADLSGYTVAVDRAADSRGGSTALHDLAVPGTQLQISEPRNHFPLTRALNYVLVAGGIGVTPLVALAARVARSGRPWRMLCLSRTAGTMPYLPELRSAYGAAVTFHGSAAGRLDLAGALADLPRGTAVYVCGPGTLADDVATAVAGQPAVDVFTEQFTAPETSGTNTSFDVSLASTGDTVTVPPDASVLQVLEAHGTPVASSCREGMCGTCEVDVVSGEVDHRDSVLTPEERGENESMMVCVSRCVSGRLVLDL